MGKAAQNKYVLLHNERRKQIINTAKKLILDNNITSITMSDIAAACGISRQTLYKYFGSFDAVVYGIQGDIIEGLSAPTGATMADYLCSAADMLYHYYKTDHDDFMFICLFDVYIRTHKTEDENNRHYREVIFERMPNMKDFMNTLPPDNGNFNPRDFFVVAIHMIWGFITRMAVLGNNYFEPGNVSEEKSLQIIKDMLISYLKTNGIV